MNLEWTQIKNRWRFPHTDQSRVSVGLSIHPLVRLSDTRRLAGLAVCGPAMVGQRAKETYPWSSFLIAPILQHGDVNARHRIQQPTLKLHFVCYRVHDLSGLVSLLRVSVSAARATGHVQHLRALAPAPAPAPTPTPWPPCSPRPSPAPSSRGLPVRSHFCLIYHEAAADKTTQSGKKKTQPVCQPSTPTPIPIPTSIEHTGNRRQLTRWARR